MHYINLHLHYITLPVNRTSEIEHHRVMGGKRNMEMFGSFMDPFICSLDGQQSATRNSNISYDTLQPVIDFITGHPDNC